MSIVKKIAGNDNLIVSEADNKMVIGSDNVGTDLLNNKEEPVENGKSFTNSPEQSEPLETIHDDMDKKDTLYKGFLENWISNKEGN